MTNEVIPHLREPELAGMMLAHIVDVLGKAATDQWKVDPSDDTNTVTYVFWIITIRGCGMDPAAAMPTAAEAAFEFREWLLLPSHKTPQLWRSLEAAALEAVRTLRTHWKGDESTRYDFCRAFAHLLSYDGAMNDNKRALLPIVLGGMGISPDEWAKVAMDPTA